MITKLITEITVEDICKGFVYNELEGKGLFGLSGKLTIQPEYQRNYIYADGKKVSDAERYERCGRTISIPVVEAIGRKLHEFY